VTKSANLYLVQHVTSSDFVHVICSRKTIYRKSLTSTPR